MEPGVARAMLRAYREFGDGLKNVLQLGRKKGEAPIPENETVTGERVVVIRKRRSSDEVREGTF